MNELTRSLYIASIALATPFSCFLSALLGGTYRRAYLLNHLSYDLRLRNLLLIRCGFPQRFSQGIGGELADGRADVERLDALGPERLIAKEGLNDGGLSWVSGVV